MYKRQLNGLVESKKLAKSPLKHLIAAVSVGIYEGEAVLDLDYPEDSNANTDMNVVMTDANGFIEVQGTAEDGSYSADELQEMLKLAQLGIGQLVQIQKMALAQ